jgi:hypothetical protein
MFLSDVEIDEYCKELATYLNGKWQSGQYNFLNRTFTGKNSLANMVDRDFEAAFIKISR